MYCVSLQIIRQHLLPWRSSIHFYVILTLIGSACSDNITLRHSSLVRRTLWFSALNAHYWLSVCIHYLSSLYRSTPSALLSCCYACGNMLWLKLQDAATHIHTYTHTVHHIHVDNPSPGPHTAPATFTPTDTRTQIHTHLLQPLNTSDPEPRLAAKAGWVMNQGEDQRRTRDRWAKASTARRRLFIAKASKSLAWPEPWQRRSEMSFWSDDNDCVSLWKRTKKSDTICYLCSWLERQLSVPKEP